MAGSLQGPGAGGAVGGDAEPAALAAGEAADGGFAFGGGGDEVPAGGVGGGFDEGRECGWWRSLKEACHPEPAKDL